MQFDEIPSCPLLPILQLVQWMKRPLAFLDESYRRYGRYFFLQLSGLPKILVVSDREDIRQLFSMSVNDLDIGNDNEIIEPITGPTSLLNLKGKIHLEVKKHLGVYFNGERLVQFQETIDVLTRQTLLEWKGCKHVEVLSSCQKFAFQVIAELLFPELNRSQKNELNEGLLGLLSITTNPIRALILFIPLLRKDLGSFSPGGRLIKKRSYVKKILSEHIRALQKSDTSQDNSLLFAINEIANKFFPLDPESFVLDQVLTLLIAGFETTASALAWTIYAQSLHGECAVANQEAFIAEVLRYYPVTPIAFSRVAKSQVTLGDLTIPKDTLIAPCIYLAHRNKDVFDRPYEFIPDRFTKQTFSASEFFPFGGGLRRCLGASLAMNEISSFMNQMQQYQIRLSDRTRSNPPATPRRRTVTLEPDKPIWISVEGIR